MKWIFVVLFGLGSAGALAMAFTESGAPRTVIPRTAPELSLRQFPGLVAVAGLPKGPEPVNTPEPVAAKTPEPVAAKTPEPVPAKTPEPVAVKAPEPVAVKPPEPAKTPEKVPAPVLAKTPEKTPEPVAAKTPEKAPEPVAAKPPEPVVAKPPEPKAPPPEGMLNLRASDTADVYLDGKKLGGSPLLGIKAKAGNHKVRFDCYDAAGNTVAGPVQVISVKADAEVDVEYPCPVE
ncbi:MAG: hypothetical protein Q8L48_21865 [Archangium sp.]|nr:hypothetical protein [Archangium sp.]